MKQNLSTTLSMHAYGVNFSTENTNNFWKFKSTCIFSSLLHIALRRHIFLTCHEIGQFKSWAVSHENMPQKSLYQYRSILQSFQCWCVNHSEWLVSFFYILLSFLDMHGSLQYSSPLTLLTSTNFVLPFEYKCFWHPFCLIKFN